MTTFNAIGITTGVSAGVCALSFAFFGVANRARSIIIAPRCTARPKDTIFNPKAKPGKRSFLRFGRMDSDGKKNDDGQDGGGGGEEDKRLQDERNRNEIQYRGTAIFGWIPWVLSLSYDQLLTGVPGTGTRKGGMEGNLLKVNLDGIVLLRFHALCLRVAIVATIIGIGLILPLNITARCFKGNSNPLCNSTQYNLTDFQVTTLANIPALDISSIDPEDKAWYSAWFGSSILIFGAEYSSLLGRLYAVVLFSWVIVFYTLHLINSEWVDALALRRVYYLEGHHWENRVSELNNTVLRIESDDEDDDDNNEKEGIVRRRKINKLRKRKGKVKKQKELPKRDPWIPHPEQRETVPNIELYSVLVGNIPNLPGEIAPGGDLESYGFSKKQSIDWQLAVTTTFFDQCVPNQPGFSSSVAAVTILPDAPKLAKAWRTWYKHAALLRRLRFIRRLIAKKRHYDIDEMDDDDSDDEMQLQKQLMVDPSKPMNEGQSLDVLFPVQPVNDTAVSEPANVVVSSNSQLLPVGPDHLDIEQGGHNANLPPEDEDQKRIQNRIDYYNNVFGSQLDNEDELENTLLVHALSYGPEQTAVYSREFAQGAAACCPNGCREQRLHSYSLKQLEELESAIKIEVQESFKELTRAQDSNLVSVRELHAARKNENKLRKKEALHKTSSVEVTTLPSAYDVESKLFSQTPKRFEMQNKNNKMNPELVALKDRKHDEPPVYSTPVQQKKFQETSFDPRSLRTAGSESLSVNSHSLNFNLTNQGKVIFRDLYDDSDSFIATGEDVPTAGSRRRLDTGFSHVSSNHESQENWARVQQIVNDDEVAKGIQKKEKRITADGVWVYVPIKMVIKEIVNRILEWSRKTKDAVDELRAESTFAVVTFTSRQAAIAARHCLADGRGVNRWTPIEHIPIPPLADAAAFDLKTCRGCCRPVTLTVNSNQQFIRKWATILMLVIIYVFYTVPITFFQTIVQPEKLENVFPGITKYAEENPFFNKLLVGILPALGFVLFFALCPSIFKALSNFGSNAISVNHAELLALHYYWFFMAVTAFAGPSLANLAISYILARGNYQVSFTSILLEMANGLSSRLSSVWLNWILVRTLVVLPLQYLLQINTFLFQWMGWNCCRRCSQGGGPGGPVPYRIYVDSGVVFMCISALAPVTPLVAPVALLYFLFCAPLWRRNCIFMYRPKFDTGGLRWPFLTDVLLTSLIIGQILLTTVMALKEAVGPAFFAAVPIIIIILNRRWNRKRYLRAYTDAALLQTSQLDGWDSNMSTSPEKREEYRKFLVDAHKAAYVPICIAGGATAALTAEPALVVPHPNDVLIPAPMEEEQTIYHNFNGNMNPHMYPQERATTPLLYQTPPPQLSHNLTSRAKFQVMASTRRLGAVGVMNEPPVYSRDDDISYH